MNDKYTGMPKSKRIRAARWLIVCGALLAGGLVVYSMVQPSGASSKTTSVEYIPQSRITAAAPAVSIVQSRGTDNTKDVGNGQGAQPDVAAKAIVDTQPVAISSITTTLTISVSQSVLTLNNVTVQLRAIRVQPAATEADICLKLPSNADWLPRVELVFADQHLEADMMQLIDSKNPATYSGANRCYLYSFPRVIDVQTTTKGTPVTMMVTRIATSFPDAITEQDCAQAREKLKGIQPQVSFQCKQDGGRIYFSVDQKPDDMTNAQAGRAVMDAFSEVVMGPWTFTAIVQ